LIVPFVGIKGIDLLLSASGLMRIL
jgi:high-affinity K+ transport system ATPase subunit B